MRLRRELIALPVALGAVVCLLRAPELPAALAQPSAGKPEPAFKAEGVAFLKKHCLACHSGAKPKADLALDKYADDTALLKDRKVWTRVLDVLKAGEMPPPAKPQPTTGEREQFAKLVGDVFQKHDRNAKPDPGRVTMRRLNRNEYNNTVRDLVGIDFNPAEDFPSDDVGHGFDNIGDVLTLPPVLLERYLAAAETIMARAITPIPPPITARRQGAWFTEPAGPKVPTRNNWRIISVGTKDAIATGPVHTPVKVPDNGISDFTLRTKVYAETTGKEPVKIAFLVCCDKNAPGVASDEDVKQLSGAAVNSLRPFKIVEIVEVKDRTEKTAKQITVKLGPTPGLHRIAVALVKPAVVAEKPPQPEGGLHRIATALGKPEESGPKLYMQFMSLDGPLDSRPNTHKALLKCDEKKSVAERSREVLERFTTRAYRRPVTKDELDRLLLLASTRLAKGEKWEAAMQFAMTAVLVSPKFLFRVELDDRPDSADPHPIDEYQLASRMSYFIWSSMPDQELFDLAAKRQLSKNIDAQVKRMLRDPKATALVDNFVIQWLQLQPLKNANPDPKKFPQFNEQLRAAMLKETQMFFAEIVREDRRVLDILDADFTYVNGPLARLYGIPHTPKGGRRRDYEEFVRIELKGTNRGGVLTQASVLTVTSNPGRTSPVKRGRYVLEQLLGTPPPPPPANVPELEKDGKPVNAGTLRQQMEAHRKNPACANCHAKMDGLGFGLENFDAIGGFRTKDGDAAIDSSGELPGNVTFTGPAELKAVLLGKKDLFTRCLAEKMLTYALGRGLEFYDRRAVDAITTAVAKQDYKFSALVTEIVKSDPFRMRRGKGQ
jgi:mono/diheme cytochrome c family protein